VCGEPTVYRIEAFSAHASDANMSFSLWVRITQLKCFQCICVAHLDCSRTRD
jgi:hypothetical protein